MVDWSAMTLELPRMPCCPSTVSAAMEEYTGIVSGMVQSLNRFSQIAYILPLSYIFYIPTRLTGPDGQQVYCAPGNCPPNNQAFQNPDDYGALRNSAQGGTYTHVFCG
jgi:hypothetical protein